MRNRSKRNPRHGDCKYHLPRPPSDAVKRLIPMLFDASASAGACARNRPRWRYGMAARGLRGLFVRVVVAQPAPLVFSQRGIVRTDAQTAAHFVTEPRIVPIMD